MIPENLEAIIVLGGEDKERRRSKRALSIYQEDGPLPIIVSGSHSGIHGIIRASGIEAESHEMRNYLLSQGVKDSDIIIEDKSMDTLANFYFSYPKIESCENIGVVTDEHHLDRSLWCAKKVFGRDLIGIPARLMNELGKSELFKYLLVEKAAKSALRTDFALLGIEDGDYRAMTWYMENIHPYHAYAHGKSPRPSMYFMQLAFIKQFLRK